MKSSDREKEKQSNNQIIPEENTLKYKYHKSPDKKNINSNVNLSKKILNSMIKQQRKQLINNLKHPNKKVKLSNNTKLSTKPFDKISSSIINNGINFLNNNLNNKNINNMNNMKNLNIEIEDNDVLKKLSTSKSAKSNNTIGNLASYNNYNNNINSFQSSSLGINKTISERIGRIHTINSSNSKEFLSNLNNLKYEESDSSSDNDFRNIYISQNIRNINKSNKFKDIQKNLKNGYNTNSNSIINNIIQNDNFKTGNINQNNKNISNKNNTNAFFINKNLFQSPKIPITADTAAINNTANTANTTNNIVNKNNLNNNLTNQDNEIIERYFSRKKLATLSNQASSKEVNQMILRKKNSLLNSNNHSNKKHKIAITNTLGLTNLANINLTSKINENNLDKDNMNSHLNKISQIIRNSKGNVGLSGTNSSAKSVNHINLVNNDYNNNNSNDIFSFNGKNNHSKSNGLKKSNRNSNENFINNTNININNINTKTNINSLNNSYYFNQSNVSGKIATNINNDKVSQVPGKAIKNKISNKNILSTFNSKILSLTLIINNDKKISSDNLNNYNSLVNNDKITDLYNCMSNRSINKYKEKTSSDSKVIPFKVNHTKSNDNDQDLNNNNNNIRLISFKPDYSNKDIISISNNNSNKSLSNNKSIRKIFDFNINKKIEETAFNANHINNNKFDYKDNKQSNDPRDNLFLRNSFNNSNFAINNSSSSNLMINSNKNLFNYKTSSANSLSKVRESNNIENNIANENMINSNKEINRSNINDSNQKPSIFNRLTKTIKKLFNKQNGNEENKNFTSNVNSDIKNSNNKINLSLNSYHNSFHSNSFISNCSKERKANKSNTNNIILNVDFNKLGQSNSFSEIGNLSKTSLVKLNTKDNENDNENENNNNNGFNLYSKINLSKNTFSSKSSFSKSNKTNNEGKEEQDVKNKSYISNSPNPSNKNNDINKNNDLNIISNRESSSYFASPQNKKFKFTRKQTLLDRINPEALEEYKELKRQNTKHQKTKVIFEDQANSNNNDNNKYHNDVINSYNYFGEKNINKNNINIDDKDINNQISKINILTEEERKILKFSNIYDSKSEDEDVSEEYIPKFYNIKPNSLFITVWKNLYSLFILIMILIYGLKFSFKTFRAHTAFQLTLEFLLVDCVIISNIMIKLITGIPKNNYISYDIKYIFNKYLRSYLIFELIAIFPFQIIKFTVYLVNYYKSNNHYFKTDYFYEFHSLPDYSVLKNKLLFTIIEDLSYSSKLLLIALLIQWLNLSNILEKKNNLIEFALTKIKNIKYIYFIINYIANLKATFSLVGIFLLITHVCTCLFIYVGYLDKDLQINSQERYSPTWIEKENFNSLTEVYLSGIYFILTTFLTVGYGDIVPLNSREKLVSILFLLIGCLIYSFTLTTISTLFTIDSKTREQYEEKKKLLNNIVEEYVIPSDLYSRINRSIYNEYNSGNNERIDFLAGLPNVIKNELFVKMYSDKIKSLEFFRILEKEEYGVEEYFSGSSNLHGGLSGNLTMNNNHTGNDNRLLSKESLDSNNNLRSPTSLALNKSSLNATNTTLQAPGNLFSSNVLKQSNNNITNNNQLFQVPHFPTQPHAKLKIDDFISFVIPLLKTSAYSKDEEIWSVGQLVDEMFMVYKGKVNLNLGKDFQNYILGSLNKNKHYGEVLMFLDNPISQFDIVIGSRNCDIFTITKKDFQKIIENFPDQIGKILKKSVKNQIELENLRLVAIEYYLINLTFNGFKNLISTITREEIIEYLIADERIFNSKADSKLSSFTYRNSNISNSVKKLKNDNVFSDSSANSNSNNIKEALNNKIVSTYFKRRFGKRIVNRFKNLNKNIKKKILLNSSNIKTYRKFTNNSNELRVISTLPRKNRLIKKASTSNSRLSRTNNVVVSLSNYSKSKSKRSMSHSNNDNNSNIRKKIVKRAKTKTQRKIFLNKNCKSNPYSKIGLYSSMSVGSNSHYSHSKNKYNNNKDHNNHDLRSSNSECSRNSLHNISSINASLKLENSRSNSIFASVTKINKKNKNKNLNNIQLLTNNANNSKFTNLPNYNSNSIYDSNLGGDENESSLISHTFNMKSEKKDINKGRKRISSFQSQSIHIDKSAVGLNGVNFNNNYNNIYNNIKTSSFKEKFNSKKRNLVDIENNYIIEEEDSDKISYKKKIKKISNDIMFDNYKKGLESKKSNSKAEVKKTASELSVNHIISPEVEVNEYYNNSINNNNSSTYSNLISLVKIKTDDFNNRLTSNTTMRSKSKIIRNSINKHKITSKVSFNQLSNQPHNNNNNNKTTLSNSNKRILDKLNNTSIAINRGNKKENKIHYREITNQAFYLRLQKSLGLLNKLKDHYLLSNNINLNNNNTNTNTNNISNISNNDKQESLYFDRQENDICFNSLTTSFKKSDSFLTKLKHFNSINTVFNKESKDTKGLRDISCSLLLESPKNKNNKSIIRRSNSDLICYNSGASVIRIIEDSELNNYDMKLKKKKTTIKKTLKKLRKSDSVRMKFNDNRMKSFAEETRDDYDYDKRAKYLSDNNYNKDNKNSNSCNAEEYNKHVNDNKAKNSKSNNTNCNGNNSICSICGGYNESNNSNINNSNINDIIWDDSCADSEENSVINKTRLSKKKSRSICNCKESLNENYNSLKINKTNKINKDTKPIFKTKLQYIVEEEKSSSSQKTLSNNSENYNNNYDKDKNNLHLSNNYSSNNNNNKQVFYLPNKKFSSFKNLALFRNLNSKAFTEDISNYDTMIENKFSSLYNHCEKSNIISNTNSKSIFDEIALHRKTRIGGGSTDNVLKINSDNSINKSSDEDSNSFKANIPTAKVTSKFYDHQNLSNTIITENIYNMNAITNNFVNQVISKNRSNNKNSKFSSKLISPSKSKNMKYSSNSNNSKVSKISRLSYINSNNSKSNSTIRIKTKNNNNNNNINNNFTSNTSIDSLSYNSKISKSIKTITNVTPNNLKLKSSKRKIKVNNKYSNNTVILKRSYLSNDKVLNNHDNIDFNKQINRMTSKLKEINNINSNTNSSNSKIKYNYTRGRNNTVSQQLPSITLTFDKQTDKYFYNNNSNSNNVNNNINTNDIYDKTNNKSLGSIFTSQISNINNNKETNTFTNITNNTMISNITNNNIHSASNNLHRKNKSHLDIKLDDYNYTGNNYHSFNFNKQNSNLSNAIKSDESNNEKKERNEEIEFNDYINNSSNNSSKNKKLQFHSETIKLHSINNVNNTHINNINNTNTTNYSRFKKENYSNNNLSKYDNNKANNNSKQQQQHYKHNTNKEIYSLNRKRVNKQKNNEEEGVYQENLDRINKKNSEITVINKNQVSPVKMKRKRKLSSSTRILNIKSILNNDNNNNNNKLKFDIIHENSVNSKVIISNSNNEDSVVNSDNIEVVKLNKLNGMNNSNTNAIANSNTNTDKTSSNHKTKSFLFNEGGKKEPKLSTQLNAFISKYNRFSVNSTYSSYANVNSLNNVINDKEDELIKKKSFSNNNVSKINEVSKLMESRNSGRGINYSDKNIKSNNESIVHSKDKKRKSNFNPYTSQVVFLEKNDNNNNNNNNLLDTSQLYINNHNSYKNASNNNTKHKNNKNSYVKKQEENEYISPIKMKSKKNNSNSHKATQKSSKLIPNTSSTKEKNHNLKLKHTGFSNLGLNILEQNKNMEQRLINELQIKIGHSFQLENNKTVQSMVKDYLETHKDQTLNNKKMNENNRENRERERNQVNSNNVHLINHHSSANFGHIFTNNNNSSNFLNIKNNHSEIDSVIRRSKEKVNKSVKSNESDSFNYSNRKIAIRNKNKKKSSKLN